MNPDLVNWTEFCMESLISGEHGVVEGFSLGNFQMRPGLVNWMECCTKSPIDGEHGVAGGVSFEKSRWTLTQGYGRNIFQRLVNRPWLGELKE